MSGAEKIEGTSLGGLARLALQRARFAARRSMLRVLGALTADRVREHAQRHNDFLFTELGVDRAAAESEYRAASALAGRATRNDESIHYLAFAALKASGFQPNNVLELGTASGETTAYLAALFQDAVVYTFELPDDDPMLRQFHGEGLDHSALDERLKRPNIRAFRANTAFLNRMKLPDFDLIWLDAGHEYPEVAWDHAYCLAKLRPGGWVFSDDIRPPENRLFRGEAGALDAYNVTAYFNERDTTQFRYLLKREDPFLYVVDRKYVAVLHRPVL